MRVNKFVKSLSWRLDKILNRAKVLMKYENIIFEVRLFFTLFEIFLNVFHFFHFFLMEIIYKYLEICVGEINCQLK